MIGQDGNGCLDFPTFDVKTTQKYARKDTSVLAECAAVYCVPCYGRCGAP